MKKNLQFILSGGLKSTLILTPLLFAFQSNAQCTADITIDSVVACFGDTTGVLSFTPPLGNPPLMISEVDRNSPDLIEIENVTGAPFDATGYYVACSDDYTNINIGNSITWNLSGVVPAGWVDYRDDATGANYWGNNLFFNGTSAGWVAICDPNHNVIDVFFWEWTAADIATFAPVIGGNTLVLNAGSWNGDGLIGGCSSGAMTRSTNIENNDSFDWTCGNAVTPGLSNMSVTPLSNTGIASITWSTADTTEAINNLGAGTYFLTVVDSLGCIASDTVVLAQPAQLSDSSALTSVLCNGDSTGTAMLITSGGTGSITIDWGTDNPMMLPEGYADYTLTDSLGCTLIDSVLINSPTALLVDLTASSVPCFGDTTGGMVNANVTGGMPGYLYSWSTGDSTSNVMDINAGWYTVNIIDTNGCSVVDSVEVNEPTMLTLNGSTSDELFGNDGSIDLTVGGGTMPYTFSWTNGASSVEDPMGLSANTYDVTVFDDNGCSITGTYVVGSQVGTNDLGELQLSVFPNPSNGLINIQVDQTRGNSNIEILNAVGQIVYESSVIGSTHQVDLQALEVGVYFVKLYTSNANSVIRVLKK